MFKEEYGFNNNIIVEMDSSLSFILSNAYNKIKSTQAISLYQPPCLQTIKNNNKIIDQNDPIFIDTNKYIYIVYTIEFGQYTLFAPSSNIKIIGTYTSRNKANKISKQNEGSIVYKSKLS